MGQFFGYVQIVENNTYQVDVGPAGINGVLIGNESGLTVVVSMIGNNLSRSLYPGTVDFFPAAWGFSGLIKFQTSALLSNSASWPGSFLQIDIVGANEVVSGQYPFALARIANIGNQVNTSMGAATSIVNDGNTAGTQIVEATTGADASSAVTLTNNGQLTLGNLVGRVGSLTIQGGGTLATDGAISSTVGGTALSIVGSSVLDNGAILTDGSGDVTLNGSLTMGGHVSVGQTLSTQTIAQGGTISVGLEGMITVTVTASRTGVILQAGQHAGHNIAVVNTSGSFTITFAAQGTSNVVDGTNKIIQPFSIMFFYWDGFNSRWYAR